MADQVGPPEQQAEEALREAYRKLAEEGEYPQCDGGPDCQCPFHWHLRVHQAQIRSLAAIPPVDTGWPDYPGECTGCGLDDQPVKGPPGAELCRFCDQLRVMPPLPVAQFSRRRIIMIPSGPVGLPAPPEIARWMMYLGTAVLAGCLLAFLLITMGAP
jgi:hypothetical protein